MKCNPVIPTSVIPLLALQSPKSTNKTTAPPYFTPPIALNHNINPSPSSDLSFADSVSVSLISTESRKSVSYCGSSEASRWETVFILCCLFVSGYRLHFSIHHMKRTPLITTPTHAPAASTPHNSSSNKSSSTHPFDAPITTKSTPTSSSDPPREVEASQQNPSSHLLAHPAKEVKVTRRLRDLAALFQQDTSEQVAVRNRVSCLLKHNVALQAAACA